LDINSVGKKVIEVFQRKVNELGLGNPTLALEPGRFLVGDAGYLISRVLGIKESYETFVGVDAGFNTLIRPALYNAKHPIVIPEKENIEEKIMVNICGQICENTDIFATDRMLPPLEEGDLLVFKQVGAYGNVMSMPYNLRLRPAEVAIINGKDIEITRRETMNDYFSRISF